MKHGNRDYVSLEQAKLLKKLGFDWEVGACYSALKEELYTSLPPANYNDPEENDYFGEDGEDGQKPYSAPMLIEVQEWIRKVGNISIEVMTVKEFDMFVWHVYIQPLNTDARGQWYAPYVDYEDALSDAITHCLEKIKTEKYGKE